MNIDISLSEARVIGCLIEKQITTPDQYPLSLNALTAACNQKSNRDPILNLDERAVQGVIDTLIRKHYVIERSGFGSRVPKYSQVFCNSEFGSLKFTPVETAIICELMLRGPQTPGELRARTPRMAQVAGPQEVDAAIESLSTRSDGPFIRQLPREPGRREHRYLHLFSSEEATMPSLSLQAGPETPPPTSDADRLTRLEALVDTLCKEIAELKSKVQ